MALVDFALDAGACVLGVTAVGAGSKVAKNMATRRAQAKLAAEENKGQQESILNQASEAVMAAFAQKSQVVPSQVVPSQVVPSQVVPSQVVPSQE
jgi:hypothetical protein